MQQAQEREHRLLMLTGRPAIEQPHDAQCHLLPALLCPAHKGHLLQPLIQAQVVLEHGRLHTSGRLRLGLRVHGQAEQHVRTAPRRTRVRGIVGPEPAIG